MKIISYKLKTSIFHPTCIINDGIKNYQIKCYPHGTYFYDIGSITNTDNMFINRSSAILIRDFDTNLNERLEEIMDIARTVETVEDLIDIFSMSDIL